MSVRSKITRTPFAAPASPAVWQELAAAFALAAAVSVDLSAAAQQSWQELAANIGIASSVSADISTAFWQELAANLGFSSAVTADLTVAKQPLLLSPRAGDTFQAADTIYLAAAIPSGAPTVTGVEFFRAGNVKIGDAALVGTIWTLSWSGAASSAHTLTAKVTYSGGVTATSPGVAVTVAAAPTTTPASSAATLAWFDTSDLANMSVASGLVSQVNNKMGTATIGHAVQATTSLQPVVDWFRGVRCTYFGADAQERMVATITGTIATGWRMFCGARPNKPSSSLAICMTAASGGALHVGGSATWPTTADVNANVQLPSAGAFAACKPHVMMGVGGTGGDLHIDGSRPANVNPVSTGSRTLVTSLAFGGSQTGTSAFSGCIAEPVVASASMTLAEANAIETALTTKYHTLEPGLSVLSVGDSVLLGYQDTATPAGGVRKRAWDQVFGPAKTAGRWIESAGSLPASAAQWIDDSHFCNTGKGISYTVTNIAPLIGAGKQYNPDIFEVLLAAGNLRELAPETYVPGTGPGTTAQAYIDMCVTTLLGSCPAAQMIIYNLVDCNPLLGTGPNDYWTRLRTWNDLLVSTIIPAITAATGKTIIFGDMFSAMGTFDQTNYHADGLHPIGPGYDKMTPVAIDCRIRAAALT